MSNESSAFFGGMAAGVFVMAVLMHISESSPRQIEQKYQQEALQLGYATNLIIFQNEEFKVQFQWITNKGTVQ